MSFTDEQIKQFKEWAHAKGPVSLQGLEKTVDALLARLEAAERLIKYAHFYEPISKEDENTYDNDMNAWLGLCWGYR